MVKYGPFSLTSANQMRALSVFLLAYSITAADEVDEWMKENKEFKPENFKPESYQC